MASLNKFDFSSLLGYGGDKLKICLTILQFFKISFHCAKQFCGSGFARIHIVGGLDPDPGGEKPSKVLKT